MMNDETVEQKVSEEKCTGCAACMNICPTLAISMKENQEGFPMRSVDASLCVNCGKCVDICPILHVAKDNDLNPGCYAFRADDEVRAHSSSGGFFPVFARKILEDGGIVCGAVYDCDFGVKLTLAETWEDVAPMRGSKYVQSDPGFVYKKIKTLLDGGKKVLFTGTPCQVAGLNAFLGKRHENLLSVDLVCHGVPPQKLLKRHLAEVAKGRQVKSVSFRDKRYGWVATILRVEFTDGSSYTGREKEDPYEAGFHPNLFLRKSCEDCPFCAFPRQGDLSIGDFWGYGKLEPEYKDSKGTSLIFTNNEKGAREIDLLTSIVEFCRKVECDIKAIQNRLMSKFPAHNQRDRFFALADRMSLAKAVKYARERYFDVGIVGNYLSENFGSVMTYYALYHVINDLGWTTLMIDRPRSAPVKPVVADKLLEKGSYPYYDMSVTRENKNHMREFNKHCASFVVGSDQLFNAAVYKAFDGFMSLEWVFNNKKKIAYAASCGHEDVWGSNELKAEMSYWLKQFDAISVREKSAVEVFKRVFDVESTPVLDPVFLCAESHWRKLADLTLENELEHEKYIYSYILDPDSDKQKILEEVREAKDLPYVLFTEFGRKKNFYLNVRYAKVNTQIAGLMNCDYVVTDSFHGVCFAIIFRKDFVVVANKNRGYTRFLSILEDSGLKHKMVHSLVEFETRKDILLKHIDYEIVYSKLKPMINKSREWLRTWLERSFRNPLTDFDMAYKLIEELRSEIERKYGKRIKELEEKSLINK